MTSVRDNLGLVPTSRPKDHYIFLLASQTSLGTLYRSALLGCSLTTSRTTADIDIAVPSGHDGYGVLLDILGRPPFVHDTEGFLPRGSYYFFVESSGNFVEVDGISAGFMAFPKIEKAGIIQPKNYF